ncbi:flagellar biosynthesis protein FlhA (plasmid) [Roseivivax marinus]|jgi:flagellar biosynthesis protein FlhA|uniref:flagellar biosynthesis protein FlhA n=1 Tax=Roseivivax marinus TaxID=1379903 RepID=UPI001F03541D|nr:flagellar biosynthesis protein FlhA [Roseivivax marinus]UMA66853.1 flagellar biosynthesis protein FlhA [Roseivivax marinus]
MATPPASPIGPVRGVASGRILANRDVGFALGVTMILAVLFVPLPPVLLDFGLALSLSVSVLVLMVALWIRTPLEFNAFPTLLLVVTLLRLSLNVASTRLILSQGHTGTSAAGGVIEGFSRFIVAGSFVIGLVIFAILVVINFIVITKGSTRIAEVSARFSLDAMPGKQMAIDADLGAGLIDDAQAKERRKTLEEESGFFGAMDGASKFVRGDAVAGIIITLINVIGGILIGTVQHGMSIGDAASTYTTLTIGDGLVSQIPALIVAMAAGFIVTKGGTEGAANEVVLAQLGRFPKALYMAGGLLFGIGLLPGFPLPVFAALALGMATLGYVMQRAAAEADRDSEADAARAAEPPAKSEGEVLADSMRVDDLCLELGAGLVVLSDSADAALPGKIKSLRGVFAREYGFVLPTVRIRDEPSLPSNGYRIMAQGVEAATGDLRAHGRLLLSPPDQAAFPGERTKDPAFGLDAIWVDADTADSAEAQGLTVVDPESVLTTHLTETVKEHMADLLSFRATREAIERLDKDYQKLVSDLPVPTPTIIVQHVLQRLLAERVSIRNLPLIVEAIAEAARGTSSAMRITEHVRQRLASQICGAMTSESGYIPVIGLSPAWEREFVEALRSGDPDPSFLMSPQRVQDFVLAARKEIQTHAATDAWPAILVSADVRHFVRSMLERVSPTTPIISHAEIHRKAALRTVGQIA